MTRVVALDLALTVTGVAVGTVRPPQEVNGDPVIDVAISRIASTKTGMERLSELRRRILATVETSPPDLVIIEGYSFNSKDSHAHALGELGGVVKLTLFERGYVFVDAPPASLKLYASGRGNAPKALVLTDAVRRLGFAGSDNNEADALWLLAMGLDWLGHPLVAMPDHNRQGLGKIPWPDGLRPLNAEQG